MWDEVPASTQLSGVINSTGEKIVPWAAEQLPLPLSSVGDHAEHADHAGHSDMANTATPVQGIPAGTPVDLDSVIALARSMNVVPTFVVSLTADEQGVYTVTVSTADFSGSDARDEVTTHIDQYSGAVLANVGWNDYGIVPKVVSMGNAIHEGKQFGIVNQAVIVLACVVVLLAVSGVVLWWQRRPAGRLGASAKPRQRRASLAAVAIMAVIGVLFPLVGVSLVAVLTLDWLLISGVPALKRALG
jgi:uncharacterized iron-regulated membrane protein